MDPETRFELISALAKNQAWDAVMLIGKSLLDHYYPAHIFTSASGDTGPTYIVALRAALEAMKED